MFFSMSSKKRIHGGMTLLSMLQDKQNKKIENSVPKRSDNVSRVIVTPFIDPNIKNECKNECKSEEKEIIIYTVGCEEPMPVVEEPVIETVHNPNDYIEAPLDEETEEEGDEIYDEEAEEEGDEIYDQEDQEDDEEGYEI
jgi:hypothetical protein